MLTALIAIMTLFQASSAPAGAPNLLSEKGAAPSSKDGILQLGGGGGWLRTPHPMLDFEVNFEIRALALNADPGLILRTWRGWQQWPEIGYRLAIPTGDELDVAGLLVGVKQKVIVVQQGRLDLRPHGEWQAVRVTGQRGRISVSVNDTLAGEFAIAEQGGYLMFDNRKGRIELRGITLRVNELDEPVASDIMREKQLKDAGGREPQVAFEVKPRYSPEAMREQVQGSVRLEAVVLSDGLVGPVRVTRKLHPDLDVAAVAAVKAWRFRPATLNGANVPFVAEVDMSFILK